MRTRRQISLRSCESSETLVDFGAMLEQHNHEEILKIIVIVLMALSRDALWFIFHASVFVLAASQFTYEGQRQRPRSSFTSQTGEFHNAYKGPES